MTPNPGIQILGLNQVGEESGNNLICDGRDIPWLQETTTELAWRAWKVEWRDVVVLDRANQEMAKFNLTIRPLANADNYMALKTLLLDAAD